MLAKCDGSDFHSRNSVTAKELLHITVMLCKFTALVRGRMVDDVIICILPRHKNLPYIGIQFTLIWHKDISL